MKEPLVSVILPTHNRAYSIGRAIRSVLKQSYRSLELIIVDDGSTDQTEAVVAAMSDDRIHYIRKTINEGAAAARNAGLSEAHGELIAFQDSDDEWTPGRLNKQTSLLYESDADYVYGYIHYRKTLSGEEDRLLPAENDLSLLAGNIYPRMLQSNLIGTPALVMRRRCYEKLGGFDTAMPAVEDYDYALRLAKNFSGCFLPEIVLEAAASPDGLTADSVKNLSGACMFIGKYQEDLRTCGLFDRHITDLIDRITPLGEEVVSVTVKMLEGYLRFYQH